MPKRRHHRCSRAAAADEARSAPEQPATRPLPMKARSKAPPRRAPPEDRMAARCHRMFQPLDVGYNLDIPRLTKHCTPSNGQTGFRDSLEKRAVARWLTKVVTPRNARYTPRFACVTATPSAPAQLRPPPPRPRGAARKGPVGRPSSCAPIRCGRVPRERGRPTEDAAPVAPAPATPP